MIDVTGIATMKSGEAAHALEALLVDGHYDGSEARQLLDALMSAAVNLQTLRNLRHHVRTESSSPAARSAISELEATRESLTAMLRTARANGKPLKIRTKLEIEV